MGGVGGRGGIVPRPSGSNSPCDECLAKAIRDCAISSVPGADIPRCIYGAATANNLIDAAQAGLSCAVADLTVVAGSACNLINCYIDILQCSSGEGRAAVCGTPTFLAFDAAGRDLMTFLDYQMVTYGDPAWTPYLASPELGTLAMVLLPALEEAVDAAPGFYAIPVTAATDRQSTTALITIKVEALPSFDDFSSWAEAYQIPPERRSPEALVPGVELPNALAYALGIDPVNGISPAQPDPGLVVIPDAESIALSFRLPDGGRPALRYLVQTTTDFLTGKRSESKKVSNPGAMAVW